MIPVFVKRGSQTHTTVYFWIKIMEFDPKWVHMARYDLILRLDGALWLRIISKPLLTPKRAIRF